MCKMPNNQHEAFTVFEYAVITNLSTFKEENDLPNLSLSVDEMFAGYLESDVSEYDETTRLDRFRDYLKIKELLRIIE